MFPNAKTFIKISLIAGSILSLITFYYYLPPFEKELEPRRHEFLYQTWELVQVYRDGQRVADARNQGLVMEIFPDSSAIETVRGQSFTTYFYADKNLEYIYTGQRNKPEKYKIHTLTPNLLKYGQHNATARYEFVLKAVKSEISN